MADEALALEPGSKVKAEDPNEAARNDDGRIGLASQPPAEIAKQVLTWWRESTSASTNVRKLRKECHAMHDGDQWDKADVANRKGRPTLTFNLMLSIIAAVEGQEKNNRQEMKYYGANLDDDPGADKWNKLLRWVIEGNGGDFEQSRQFKEMLICGEGWIVPDVDFLDDPEGVIRLEWVDNDEIADDPLSTHPVGTDARYRQRIKMLTLDEGEALWPANGPDDPGFTASVRSYCLENGISETDGKGYPDIYLAKDKTDGPKLYDSKDKTWAVIQCWWWQIEPGYHVINEATGLIDEFTPEEFAAKKAERAEEQKAALNDILMQRQAPQPMPAAGGLPGLMGMPTMPSIQIPPPLKAEPRPVKRVYEAFVVPGATLECGVLKAKLKMFPAVPLRGIRRKTKGDWIGLVQPIIDAQRQHNVEQSSIVQLIQLMPKQSWMGPKGSFHNKTDWENGVAVPGKMLEYNAQRGKPEQIETPPIPRHLIDMAFSRPQAMRDISGVNVELTGNRQGSDAGVVMEQRAKAAQTVLAPLFDNARRTKKVVGKVLLAYMQAYLKPNRQIRILGDEKKGEIVNVDPQMLEGRYDLAVDETESTVNDRIATLNIMQTTLPQMMKAGVPVPPSFVDMLPMDPKIREEWKDMIGWQLMQTNALPPPGWHFGDPMPPPIDPMTGLPMVPPTVPPTAAPPAI